MGTIRQKNCQATTLKTTSSQYIYMTGINQRQRGDCFRPQRYLTAVIFVVVSLNLFNLASTNPVFVDNPSLAQFQSGRNIRNLPCIVRKSGRSGVCMFAIDCIKQNGTHLGTCIDRFYFGSCCQMKEETHLFTQEISDNSIDQNTISHFSHESTTLPTSALFKLTTTETQLQIVADRLKNKSDTVPYVPVPTVMHSGSLTTVAKPARIPPSTITTRHPTTHTIASKRTTTTTVTPNTTKVPTTTVTTSTSTTTVKPNKRNTTTLAPILTTGQLISEQQHNEVTTQPSKIFTFQMVETTIVPSTEATKFNELPIITTNRPALSTHNPRPINTTAVPIKTTTTTVRPTVPPKTTPQKYKPQATRRPSTSKKPYTASKRPTLKPSRRPTTTTTTTTTTLSPQHREPATTEGDIVQTSQKPLTTRAPRPKPKPTAEIVKVSQPTTVASTTVTTEPTTKRTTVVSSKPTPTPSTTTTSTTTTKRPRTTTRTPTIPTKTSTTTTTKAPTTTTTTSKTTTKAPTTMATSTTITAQTTKASTSTAITTERPRTTTTITSPQQTTTIRFTTAAYVIDADSTLRPGLVTWTNVDGDFGQQKNTTQTSAPAEDEDWQPRPPPADWVPVPTINPDVGLIKNATAATLAPVVDQSGIFSETSATSEQTTEGNTSSNSTEPNKIIVSISSSVSEKQNDTDSSAVAPAAVDGSNSSPATTSSSTEGYNVNQESTTTKQEAESTSEDYPGMASTATTTTTTEYTTDDYNATMIPSSTTTASINSVEGVDYKQICGRRMFPEPRIVGGSNAAFGRWPWQISLRQWRTSTYLHKCGAALLNENWAITAAHCVDNVPPSDLLLRLGEYDLAEEEEPYGYQERRVQIVASHPQFDQRTFEYDLALLRFYEPVVFQPNIIPVCVPASDQNFIGQTAFVTGWGRLYEDGPLPSVLQEVAVPVINNTICETMYRAAGYIEHIPHIFICAGWKKGGYDSCEGDSGGPMVLQREDDKRFMLGGVISWGIGCAESNQPGVYTRISEFRDWINQILQF